MSHRSSATDRSSRPFHGYTSSSGPGRKPDKGLQKIIGIALMSVGAIFTLYGAGSGVSKLIEVSLNHFGLLCVAGTINFVFWTVIVFPIGGLIANAVCAGGALMLFGGLPALPGIGVACVGAFVYYSA